MKVAVRYFASVREALGAGRDGRARAPARRVGALRDALIARGAAHAEALAAARALRSALEPGAVRRDRRAVGEGAEVGFFPPVTGG